MNDDGRSPVAIGQVVDVVAGVIRDARGRILLARRTEGRDLAGLWEFPGGKREPGESPEAALARELHEELGIDIDIGAPLIAVPQRYPHKRLRLDVRRIASWRGTPKGLEGQALAWVPPHKLPSYAMPPADRPVVAALLQPDRYLVTPAPGDDDAPWLARARSALEQRRRAASSCGVDRDRAARWHALVERRGRRVAVGAMSKCWSTATSRSRRNSDIGVHLRAAQLAALRARRWPKECLVAASCHDADELRQAERIGCDFAVLGSVARHADASGRDRHRLGRLRRIARRRLAADLRDRRPRRRTTLPRRAAHGAQGIAAIRALVDGYS